MIGLLRRFGWFAIGVATTLTVPSATLQAAADETDTTASRSSHPVFGDLVFTPTAVQENDPIRIATFAGPEGSGETLTRLLADDGLGIQAWARRTRGLFPPSATLIDIPNRNPDREALLAMVTENEADPEAPTARTYHLYAFHQQAEGLTEVREYTRTIPGDAVEEFEKGMQQYIPIWLRDLVRLEFPPFESLKAYRLLPFKRFPVEPIQPAEWIQTDPKGGSRYRILTVDEAFVKTFGGTGAPAVPIRLAVPTYLESGVSAAPEAEAFLVLGWNTDELTTDGESLTFSPLSPKDPVGDDPATLSTHAHQIESEVVAPYLQKFPESSIVDRYRTQIRDHAAIVIDAIFLDADGTKKRLQTVALFAPEEPAGMLCLWTRPAEIRFGTVGERVIHSLEFIFTEKRLQTNP